MPRTSRASRRGFVYHVLNRGNGRSDVFHKDDDFAAFVNLMREAHEKVPIRLTGYCLMTNHFHLLLWPHEDGDLSHWMQWLLASHVRRYHRHYQSSGHVWQGRFKALSRPVRWVLSHGTAICGAEPATSEHGPAQSGLGMVKSKANSSKRTRRTSV
jgi:REP element-mobilizing transposase RayT